jgi:pyruvate,water dikinase
LTSGLAGDSTVEQNTMLFHVARNEATLSDFLEQYGHRAVAEMELAKPRWREDPAYLQQIMDSQKSPAAHSPESLHHTNQQRREDAMRDLPKTLADWGGSFLREPIEALALEAQALLPYRETGKHYLLMGYELIRAAILELARRHDLADDIFFLHLDELGEISTHADELRAKIARRKIRWQSAQRLDHPDVINSADLESLGLPRKLAHANELNGLSLSAGIVQGTARIVRTPDEAKDLGNDCILICPSTDPSWTALFTTIKGLIVERGGVLSHGAITARDFAIPAVACPDATKIIKDGDIVRVNGDLGHIAIVPSTTSAPAEPQEALHA